MTLTPEMERIIEDVLATSGSPRDLYCDLVKKSLLKQLTWGEIQKVIAEADRRADRPIGRLLPVEVNTESPKLKCQGCDETECPAAENARCE